MSTSPDNKSAASHPEASEPDAAASDPWSTDDTGADDSGSYGDAGDESAAGGGSADEPSVSEPGPDGVEDPEREGAREADSGPAGPSDPQPPLRDPRDTRIRLLEATVAERESTLHEYIRAHKRSKTEFEALRSRLATEQAEQVAKAKRKLVERLLPVHDNLARSLDAARAGGTLESLRGGVDLVARQFLKELEDLGLERVDPTGEVFDPSSMEALAVLPVTDPAMDGRVMACAQPGFRLHGKEIRPALVQVGRKI